MNLDRMLAEILAIASDALVVVDDAHRVILFSPGAERIFGFSSEQVLGHPLDMLVSPTAQAAFRDDLRAFEESRVASQLLGDRGRILARRPDGSEFPAETSISRIEVDGERYLAAVIRDATDRDRIEQALRRNQAELAEAQHLARVGSWEWEIESDVVHGSDELRLIFDLEPGRALSYADFFERVHPDDRISANGLVEAAIEQGTTYEGDYRVVRGDGSVRVIHSRGSILCDADGKPQRMRGTVQDITEQREAEERARELIRQQAAREVAQAAAARFRFLAEASQILSSSLAIEETLRSVTRLTIPDIADWCSLDLVGDDGELRRVEVAHLDPDKVKLAHDIHRRFPPDGAANPAAAAALQRGEPLLIEDFSEAILRASARDPEHRELLRMLGFRSAMCVPLVARERLVGLITLATAESGRRFGPDDLSLVRSLADRAALAIDNARLFERAQAAADAREDAVATVAHDLRSPLGAMSVNVSLLHDDLSDADRTRALGRMKRGIEGMQRLINDLLDVTRLEAGAVAVRCRSCDAEVLIGDACDIEHPAAVARSVRLEVQVEPGLHVHADPDRIAQVIANLVNNAVRYSPEGASVQIAARGAGTDALVSVADEGPGVPKESRDRIFQRFWQSESRQRGAAGLGLAIARAIVELHGGRIWVEEGGECGARFCFTLPRSARSTS